MPVCRVAFCQTPELLSWLAGLMVLISEEETQAFSHKGLGASNDIVWECIWNMYSLQQSGYQGLRIACCVFLCS